MIDRVFLQCKSANLQRMIILSTSDHEDDVELHAAAKRNDVLSSRGPLDDIVQRLFLASLLSENSTIVRIWGDCPLICPKLIDEAIEKHISNDAIFTMTDTTHSYPKGQDLEIYNKEYLKTMHENLPKDSEYRTYPRDHITETLNSSEIQIVRSDLNRSEINLTVDYEADLEYVKAILEATGDINKTIRLDEVYRLLTLDSVKNREVTSQLPRNIEYNAFRKGTNG